MFIALFIVYCISALPGTASKLQEEHGQFTVASNVSLHLTLNTSDIEYKQYEQYRNNPTRAHLNMFSKYKNSKIESWVFIIFKMNNRLLILLNFSPQTISNFAILQSKICFLANLCLQGQDSLWGLSFCIRPSHHPNLTFVFEAFTKTFTSLPQPNLSEPIWKQIFGIIFEE